MTPFYIFYAASILVGAYVFGFVRGAQVAARRFDDELIEMGYEGKLKGWRK